MAIIHVGHRNRRVGWCDDVVVLCEDNDDEEGVWVDGLPMIFISNNEDTPCSSSPRAGRRRRVVVCGV